MAKGQLTKEIVTNAGNVADKVADWFRKEDEAQKWAHEKFPEQFGPKSTPQERATFAGFPEKNYYHGTANIIDAKRNSDMTNPMVDRGKPRDIIGFDDSFLGTTTKSDNQAHWFSDDPKTADTYADYNAYYKAYTSLNQDFEALRSKGLEKLDLDAGDQWDDWINKLDPEEWLSVMTLQNKIKKLVDRGSDGEMGQQMLPVRIRDSNQVATDAEGAGWLGTFSEKDRTKGVRKGTDLLEQAKIDGKDSVLFKNLNDTASKWYQKPSDQVAVINPASIRSPLAHFDLKKLGLGGAGAVLSTNLMANPNDTDLSQGIHDRANKRRQVVPGTDVPYLQGGRDSQDYSYGGQFGIPNSPEAIEQQNFYNEQTYPGMAGVRGIGEVLNSIVDTEKEYLLERSANSTNPLASKDPMGLGEFFIGEGGDFFENLGNSQPTTGMQQFDAGMVGLDLMTGGSTKVARKGAQTLYDSLDGTYINKGFDKLEEIGGDIAEVGGNVLDAGKAGAMVVGRGVDDALSATFQLPPGGNSPQLATANDSIANLLKDIEKPKTARQEPLKADIYLDDKGNNVITGSKVVAPKVIQDFGVAIDDAVKAKEQEVGRELTEDETRDVYDQATVDKFTDIKDRERILGRKDAVLRKNGEGRIVLDTLDDYEAKDLSPVLPRVAKKGKGSLMDNDFKDRKIGDDTWSAKTQGDGRTDIKWDDAFEKSNLEEQIGKENVDKVIIKQLMPRLPKRIADSNNKREVSQWFQKTYGTRGTEKGGAMETFATPEAKAQRRYQQRSMIPNAIVDMYKKDPNSLKFTDDEVAEEMNNYLGRGIIAMADDMNSLQNRLADLPEASAKKVMDLLEKQARGRLVRNKISKHLDNNLDLIPKTDIPNQSNIITNDLQLNGMSIGDIIRGAKEQEEETLRQLTLQAQKKLEDAGMLGNVYSAYRKKMGISVADWAKTSPGEKFKVVRNILVDNEQAVKWGEGKYSHLYTGKKFTKGHPLYEIGEIHTKMSDELDDAVINAGKGLNPDGTPGKITVNQDTTIHEGAGHHNQDLAKANPGGSRASYEKEINDISDLFDHLEGNFEGKGAMKVKSRASSLIGYEDYLGMKGEVGARKTADNALSGNRTLDNLAEPKSAVDYKQPQTLGKDGEWVDTTTRSQETGYNWGLQDDTPIKNNPSRLDYQDEAQVDKVLKYLNFTEELGINNPKSLDNWLEQENKALLLRIKRDLNVGDLKIPKSKDGRTNDLIKSLPDNDKPIPESAITPGYEFTETGGLLKPEPVDLSQHIGDEIIPLPWDGTSRGNKITKINDHDVDVETHGGHQFMDDKANLENNIFGASSKGVIDKILSRIKMAHRRNLRGGGDGNVLIATTDMQKGSEAFAEAPAMTAIQVIDQGTKGAKQQFNKEFKNLSASMIELNPKNFGPNPFKDLPDVHSKEFEDIMLGKKDYFVKVNGKERKINPSKIRKSLWKRMNNAGNQKLFNYKWDDLQKAQLRVGDILKGNTGNRIAVVKDPSTIKAVENKDPLTKNIYDTAIEGKSLGTLDIGAQPLQDMFPERFRQAYNRLKKQYPNRSHEQLKDSAMGVLTDSTLDANVYSETITPGLIDKIYKKK